MEYFANSCLKACVKHFHLQHHTYFSQQLLHLLSLMVKPSEIYAISYAWFPMGSSPYSYGRFTFKYGDYLSVAKAVSTCIPYLDLLVDISKNTKTDAGEALTHLN